MWACAHGQAVFFPFGGFGFGFEIGSCYVVKADMDHCIEKLVLVHNPLISPDSQV